MCIHYLLAGVSVIDEQPISSIAVQIENDEAQNNDEQENGTDSKEIQAAHKGWLMMIFLLF